MADKKLPPGASDDQFRRLSRRALLRRAAALGLSAPVVAALLAACGGDDEAPAATTAPTRSGGTTTGSSTTTAAATPAGSGSAASPAASGSPAAGASALPTRPPATDKERKVAVTAELASFDPSKDYSVVGQQHQIHVFDPIVDYRGTVEKFVETPMLAERWTNPDPSTWRFTMRKGVKFHNGQDFTAEDVAYTIGLAKESANLRALVSAISQVNVIDPGTLEIKTDGVAASLLANLAFIWIVPKQDHQARGTEAFGTKPVGTGPYKMDEWQKGQRITMSAFDGYWGGKKTPDKLITRPIAESATRVAELTTGGVDIVQDLPVPNVPQVKADKNLAVIQSKGIRQIFFPFNSVAEGPLKDKRVRQAVNFSIDRDTIIKDVLENFGEARTGPFGTQQLGFNEEASKFYSFNPQKAKQLLAEAGYSNGFDLQWNFARGSFLKDQEILETVIQNLRESGIRMTLNLMEVNQLFANQNEGNFQVGMIRWSRQYDTDSLLSGIQPLSTTQKWYKNQQVDDLIIKGRQTLNLDERKQIYQQLYQVMVDDPGYVYLHAQDQVWGKRASSNWEISLFAGNTSLTLFNQ